jgi:hypothetical protein
MNYPKSIMLYKNSKKRKKKSGAKELKIALIYAFSTMSRHSICWLSLSPLLSLLQMGGRVAIAVELNLYSCRFVFLRWIGQNSTPMSIGIDIFLEKFITQKAFVQWKRWLEGRKAVWKSGDHVGENTFLACLDCDIYKLFLKYIFLNLLK